MASKCPLTREEFESQAEPVTVVINGQEHVAEVKMFSTGSFGWYLNGKTHLRVGNKTIPVVGSKEAG